MKAQVRTMSKFFIEDSIEISAPVSKVWRVFTDPVLTGQMGGEYVSDWKVGSPFGWKGLDGKMAGYRGLTMGRHDEQAMTHPRVREAFEKLVQHKQELLALLEQTAERDDELLETMRVHSR